MAKNIGMLKGGVSKSNVGGSVDKKFSKNEVGSPTQKCNGKAMDAALDAFQLGLDLVGFVPGFGEPADLLSGAISAARGDTLGAALSAVSAIPGAGAVTGAAKVARRFKKLIGAADEAATVGKQFIKKGAPKARKGKVAELEVGTYEDLAKRSKKDGMTPDHIPSIAAVRANVEKQLGRPLTAAEARKLRNETNAIMVKTKSHEKSSRTYGGRNTAKQIKKDAADLKKAFEKDRDAWRQELIDAGHTPEAVDNAFDLLDKLNSKSGRY